MLEKVADPAGANSDKHLDELRTTDGKERDPSLPCHCSRQQGLAGAGRTNEESSSGDMRSDLMVFFRVS